MKIEDRIRELMSRGPTIMFRRGDSQILIIVDTEAHKFPIGAYNKKMDYRQTYEYRTMTSLGFVTRNGVTYTYQNGEHDIWVRFQKSKIDQIKDNCEWVDYVAYKAGGKKNGDTKEIKARVE